MKKIVLTGGPCAGKTTALARITERLEDLGFHVHTVPEAATIVFGGGLGKFARSSWEVQSKVFEVALCLENTFEQIAKAQPGPAVVICDRGVVDGQAYCPSEVWEKLERTFGNKGSLFARYDAVIHLVTAAEGAEEHYGLSTNATRIETPEEARQADQRLIMAWTGHDYLRVVSNSGDFQEKIRKVLQEVCALVGVPAPVEAEHKLIVQCNLDDIPVPHMTSEIVQNYLSSPGSRVRARTTNGHTTYTHTVKTPRGDGTREERERKISRKEYEELLTHARADAATILKSRTCFVWRSRYFEIDTFKGSNLQILELETLDLQELFEIPPFVRVIEDVTGRKEYSNEQLAVQFKS